MRALARVVLVVVALGGVSTLAALTVPALASRNYGPPAKGLNPLQILEYSARLLWDDGLLTRAAVPGAPEQDFEVQPGESVDSVSARLVTSGLITDAGVLRDYLVYTGLDTSVQAGTYKLSAAMSVVDIARQMQDATPADVTFVVLPGWRIEEIAMSLPTSGLEITPEGFVAAAVSPRGEYGFLSGATTTEGFLFPDSYVLPRATTVDGLIAAFLRNFSLHLTPDLTDGFARQGLSIYEAVTLASIIQREAVHPEEAASIASVYLNRMQIGMRLDADPTVQYAIGYNQAQQTWWTNPLSLEDLKVASAFNTYKNDGLPPTPIDSPGLNALQAVASPEETPYFYFSARCDGSGYHTFARTFSEHLQNLCP